MYEPNNARHAKEFNFLQSGTLELHTGKPTKARPAVVTGKNYRTKTPWYIYIAGEDKPIIGVGEKILTNREGVQETSSEVTQKTRKRARTLNNP